MVLTLLLACLGAPEDYDDDDGEVVPDTPDCDSLCYYLCEDQASAYEVNGEMQWCICYPADTAAGYYWIELDPTQECEV